MLLQAKEWNGAVPVRNLCVCSHEDSSFFWPHSGFRVKGIFDLQVLLCGLLSGSFHGLMDNLFGENADSVYCSVTLVWSLDSLLGMMELLPEGNCSLSVIW